MLLILAALKEEVKFILSEMEIQETVRLRPAVVFKGEYLGKDIVLAHAGVGTEKMRRASTFCLKEYQPAAAVNIGYCGALSPNLSLGDLVIADAVVHEKNEDAPILIPPLPPFSKERSGETTEIKLHTGTILTVDKVVSTPHEKAYLGTKFGAIAVDMESAGLAKAAVETGTPFAIVRSVLDPMDMHLPDFHMDAEDGVIDPIKLASDLFRHPQNILSLPQLKYCAHKARETMERFINECIKA